MEVHASAIWQAVMEEGYLTLQLKVVNALKDFIMMFQYLDAHNVDNYKFTILTPKNVSIVLQKDLFYIKVNARVVHQIHIIILLFKNVWVVLTDLYILQH